MTAQPGLQGLVLRFRSSYGLSETTARHHFIAARRFARYLERAGIGAGGITPEVVDEYMRADLSASLAENTARAYMVATRSFVYWLAEEGLVSREVADGVRAIRYRTREREVDPGAIDPELVRRFGLSCEGIEDRTRTDYESKARSYSRYLRSRGLDLESAGEGDVAAFAAKIAGDYSVDSAFAVLTTVKRFYRWLEAEGVADDAARGVPAIKKKAKRLTEPLTPETARLVLGAAERQGNRERGLRDRAIVELMLVCALKPGELHDLDVQRHAHGRPCRRLRSRRPEQARLPRLRAEGHDGLDKEIRRHEGRRRRRAAVRDRRRPGERREAQAREIVHRVDGGEALRGGRRRGARRVEGDHTHVDGDSRVPRGERGGADAARQVPDQGAVREPRVEHARQGHAGGRHRAGRRERAPRGERPGRERPEDKGGDRRARRLRPRRNRVPRGRRDRGDAREAPGELKENGRQKPPGHQQKRSWSHEGPGKTKCKGICI